MGTNFYFNDKEFDKIREDDFDSEYDYHIGKRSAAGYYCLDCNVTLCKGGEKEVHMGDSGWYDSCPKCGAPRNAEELKESSAGVELGFADSLREPKKGVASVASFTWAKDPDKVYAKIESTKNPYPVVDEYGQKFTVAEFKTMLVSQCLIRYYSSIGRQFS